MSGDQRGLVYLVSGGCGFLGKHLLKVLLEHERDAVAEIRVFDKVTDPSLEEQSTEQTKVVVIQGDITDYSQVLEASRGVDVFIHSASLVDVWYKVPESRMRSVNVTGTENVIRACVENDIPSLVYTSSMEVVGPNLRGDAFVRGNEDTPYHVEHRMPYPQTKAEAEGLVLKANGIKLKGGGTLYTCALRPTGIYGEGHELITEFWLECVKRGGAQVGGVRDETEHGRVYAGNVAWMHVMAARALRDRSQRVAGEVYYCYDDSPYKSYENFNALFYERFNFRRVRIPFFMLWIVALVNDILRWVLSPFYKFTPLLNRYTLTVVSTSFSVGTDKAYRHFQYQPLYSWPECKKRTTEYVEEFAQNYYKNA
ncbi:hypothetical protein WMY93_031704 [Mugilogobius chulae]|uniref:3-beta hydroxysteroid dehydrogenase/isomerase domain-containing protein n=1 Tax=Mugilogobius chulae TaxID=88201 RepID=A0AAW0MHA9_9GOBI